MRWQVAAVRLAHMRASSERKALPAFGTSSGSCKMRVRNAGRSSYEGPMVSLCSINGYAEAASCGERPAHDGHQSRGVRYCHGFEDGNWVQGAAGHGGRGEGEE